MIRNFRKESSLSVKYSIDCTLDTFRKEPSREAAQAAQNHKENIRFTNRKTSVSARVNRLTDTEVFLNTEKACRILREGNRQANSSSTKNQALFTSPERRHRVQTCMVFGVPSTTTLTLRTLGCCVVRARRETCERVMLIFLPKNVSF